MMHNVCLLIQSEPHVFVTFQIELLFVGAYKSVGDYEWVSAISSNPYTFSHCG